MSGHEQCQEGIFHEPKVHLASKEQAAELLKDKVVLDLVVTLKRYAGISERAIRGRPASCEGFGWDYEGRFCFMNNVGMIESGGGPELALMKLREYNLIEQVK